MKKLFYLFFVALIGISLVSLNATADNRRTIAKKYKAAAGADTLVSANGGTLYSITGLASSSSCRYSVHDASAIGCGGSDCTATNHGNPDNVMAEGGEATQYDSFPTIDFGPEGVPFNNGLLISTTTCDVNVTYN